MLLESSARGRLLGGDFGDGGACGGFVDDRLVRGERRDQDLEREVVHRSGEPAAGLVDQGRSRRR